MCCATPGRRFASLQRLRPTDVYCQAEYLASLDSTSTRMLHLQQYTEQCARCAVGPGRDESQAEGTQGAALVACRVVGGDRATPPDARGCGAGAAATYFSHV